MAEDENKKEDNNPLFKKFWEEKKELISFTGIVVAIGSLFLRMPNTDIAKAADALRMIQFLSISIMSVTIVCLWFSFLSFSYSLEKHFSKKSGIDLGNTISNVVFMIVFYFLYNLWIYVIALYKNEWQKTMSGLQTAINLFVFAIVFHFVDKIYLNRDNFSILSVLLRLMGLGIVVSIIPLVWIYLTNLNLESFFIYKTYLWNTLLYVGFANVYYFIRVYKGKNKVCKN